MLPEGPIWAAKPFDWTEAMPYMLLLAAVLLIGAVAVAVAKYVLKQTPSETISPSQQLAEYRSLYERGVMSKEEFDRLRALLGSQLREVGKSEPDSIAKEPNITKSQQGILGQMPPTPSSTPLPPTIGPGDK